MPYNPVQARMKREQRELKKEEDRKRKEDERRWRVNFDEFEYSRYARLHAAYLDWHINSGFCKLSMAKKEALLREMLPCDAPFLAMNNPEACIKFNRIFNHHLRQFVGETSSHFVTLTPGQFALSMYAANDFDIRSIQAWVRQQLLGIDFIGHIDIAPYTNFGEGRRRSPVLSYHAHVITSDADHERLVRIRRTVNSSVRAFVPGCPVMHYEEIEDGTLAELGNYISKEPTGEYRVWEKPLKRAQSHGDDSVYEMSGRFRQYAGADARPGVQRAVRSITKNYYLDKLVFSGGSRGRDLLEAMKYDALRDLPHSMRSLRQHAFSGRLSVELPEAINGSFYLRDFSYRLEWDELRKDHKRPWKV
ncbi:hypothetical protein ONR75_03215 [Rhodopseudomonas sp. P2A-2r]|uniref:hypothetical protein n=1 Tax=Rhodopseudomonas sp. P2A-2r TaxID=2991972 RepID=UPI0022346A13|nr:hypothetical protein [Rhodopseudomonas sp. P2A-2r]UZE49821.1 hypothetical protein ONR75_03215 [Rhodopseudomonas sp. P2A-2r]